MGKTTRYHPISLTVLRGAAAWSGYTLGHITQTVCDVETQSATYIAEIVAIKQKDLKLPPQKVLDKLRSSFMGDVNVTGLQWDSDHGYRVYFTVTLVDHHIKEKSEDNATFTGLD